MAIAVVYEMTALQGEHKALTAALVRLAEIVRTLPGCGGVTVLSDTDETKHFVFIERWPSQDSYDEGARHLPADAFAPIKPLLDGKPARRVLTEI